MVVFESGRQFRVDGFTAQTFYQEPANGVDEPKWILLPPSDYYPPRPESHNVGIFIGVTYSTDLVFRLS